MSVPIWITAKDFKNLSPHARLCLCTWNDNYIECDLRLLDDDAIRRYMIRNFDRRVHEVFNNLPMGVMRADMWRVAVLLKEGGIYCDADIKCLAPLDPLIEGKDDIFIYDNIGSTNVSNWFMFVREPGHPVLQSALDFMVENYERIITSDSPTIVQDFGMHCIQQAVDTYDQKVYPVEILQDYVKHEFVGSWRVSERSYNENKNLAKMKFFTTFNESGYELYGRSWISTFIDNIANVYPTASATIYAHGFDLKIKHPSITVLDFDERIPDHAAWISDLDASNAKSKYSEYVYKMIKRFSHKAFVIQHALSNIDDGYAFWVDGDVVFHDAPYDDFPASILNGMAMACQVETASNNHVESGILIFDASHPDTEKWRQEFVANYTIPNVIAMSEPYDGFIVFKSLTTSGIDYVDLNEEYGAGGIQSCPTLTFLHPELSLRYTHNIGLTGKRSYETWEEVKMTDEVFRRLENIELFSENELKYRELKKARLLALNALKK